MKKYAIMAVSAALMLGAPAVGYAQSMSDSQDVMCDQGISARIMHSDSYDPSIAASASSARVVTVPECDSGDVTSALTSLQATNIRDDLKTNPDALFAIQSKGLTVADVLGATTTDGFLTIYVQDEG
jgi:hypothetical protein